MTIHKLQSRLEPAKFYQLAPETAKALRAIGQAALENGLEASLVELVKLRSSQINGCAFCLNMHSTEAQQAGETPERLVLVGAWREAPVFTERERAALAWTEALTLVNEGHIADEIFEEACRHFSEKELAALTSAVVAINSWNRIAIAYRFTPEIKSPEMKSA